MLRARDALGTAFTGSSNVRLAVRHGLEPLGTHAHELPMVYAALAESDAELVASRPPTPSPPSASSARPLRPMAGRR